MRQKASNKVKSDRAGRIVLSILLGVFVFAAVLALTACIWTLSQWGGLTMEEIVYELTAPLEGTGNGMIEDFVLKCAVPSVLALAAVIAFLALYLRKKEHYKRNTGLMLAVFAVLLACVACYFGSKVGFVDYVRNRTTTSDFIENHYADPGKTEVTFPEKKRNLIYIYLESMEITYADRENGGAFDENCIPELTELAETYEDFSGSDSSLNGGYAMSGTTWTMGAMFGSTSGLPLNIDIERNSMSSQTEFFPQITTMGDLLEKEGYRQMLLLGSDATFGGRRLYFTQHGNYEMRDYLYAKETGRIAEDYKVWWGMEDEILFDMAKDSLSELSEGSEPFNLTLLTVDTHFTDGYVCDLCGDEFGDNQYANVMACSSRQVAAFISWCQEQDWYENTTIVITGDHPTMDGDFCVNVPSDYTRRTYTCYINSAVEPEDPDAVRTYSTFDYFPTTIAALGAKIEGERLGLGTNLFSSVQTLSEEYGQDAVNTEVSKKTEFLEKLEALDEETEEKVEKYGSVELRSVEWNLPNELITVRLGPIDYPEDDEVSYVRLKIWVNTGDQTVHRWIKTKETDEGGVYTTFSPIKYLDVYPYFYYQFVIKFKSGASYNLGAEGMIRNLPGHTWREGNEELLNEIPEGFKEEDDGE